MNYLDVINYFPILVVEIPKTVLILVPIFSLFYFYLFEKHNTRIFLPIFVNLFILYSSKLK